MTLLETLLAIAITGMVGAGVTAMMSSLSAGMIDHHDTRSSTLRAGLSQARLSSYVTRCRCLLDCEASRLVLWLEDADGDDAIDATEVRWVHHDDDDDRVMIQWLTDPQNVLDEPYANPTAVDWWDQLRQLELMATIRSGSLDLIHGVPEWAFNTPGGRSAQSRRAASMDQRTVEATFTLAVADNTFQHSLGDSIRMHDPPTEETP
ncbi:MAG: hypothetical protein QF733_01050 [Phycisphaerales bacterium]|jgi:hypothetical protein|nr:hypothetical protein [Phycisphaerales bacterium]